MRGRKYHNKPVTIDGMRFDSEKEWNRYCELNILQRAGKIRGLKRQVRFQLIPKQKGELRTERSVDYVADFVYYDDCQTKGNRKLIVEDVKGFRTKEYIIKRKLMKLMYKIEIHEV